MDNSTILLNLITPVEAVELARGDIRRSATSIITTCPACGGDMALIHNSFFCGTRCCKFTSGSVVDYLVMRSDDRSYDTVVRNLLRVFSDRLRPHMDLTAAVHSTITMQLRRNRRLLDFVLHRFRGSTTAKWQHLRTAAGKWKLGNSADYTLLFLEQHDVEKLIRLAQDAYPDAELGKLKLQPMIVLPWLRNHHTVASLTWFNPARLDGRTTDLAEYDVVYSGMLQGGPSSTEVFLHRDWQAAAKANDFWTTSNPSRISYGIMLNGFQVPEIKMTDNLTYVFDTTHDRTAWVPARLHELNPAMLVTDAPEQPACSWSRMLAKLLVNRVNSHGMLNHSGNLILGSANPQGTARVELIRYLRESGQHGVADQLTRNLFSTEIYRDAQGALYESPDGYRLARPGEVGEAVSNFSIALRTNVVFAESNDTFHTGDLVMGEHKFPLMLPSRLMDSAKDMQNEVQRVAASNKTTVVPVIRNMAAWKTVGTYLRQLPSRLTTETGTPFLGWDFHKKSFFTPAWRFTMEGRQPAGPLHPGVMLLDCFSAATVVGDDAIAEEWLADFPADVACLVSIVMGSVLRAHQDRPCRVVAVHNDRTTSGWLARVFAGLGQTQSLPRVERDMGGHLRGYPAYALAADRMTMTLKAPYFVLTDYGLVITTPMTHPAWRWVTQMVQGLTRLVAEHALSMTDPAAYTRIPRITYAGEVRDELSHLLRTEMGLRWPQFIPEYQAVEATLAAGPVALQQIVRYKFGAQILQLDMTSLDAKIDRINLAMELRALCRACEIKGDVIEIDAHTGLGMIEQYYDTPVTLPHC